MKLDPLPPIPSPPAHHWRQFRVHVLPVMSFVGVLVLTLWLWSENTVNPLVFGTAEGPTADIISPIDGRVVKLMVQQFDTVTNGQVVAVVDAAQPEVLTNTVAMIHAEMEQIRADAGFDSGDKVRYAQFQLDWMQQRTELASLKTHLTWAEAEFERTARLLKESISYQEEYDTAKRDLDDAKAQIVEKEALVQQSGEAIKRLNPDTFNPDTPAVRAGIQVAEQQLKLAEAQLQPVYLRSPINGQVTKVSKFTESMVTRAEVIATISDPNIDRILCYVSQPIRLDPKPGDPVEIRTRGTDRQRQLTEIAYVGARIELFTGPLRIRGMGAAQERGIPFVITNVPPELKVKLRPGELVDVTIPQKAGLEAHTGEMIPVGLPHGAPATAN
jgi:multidrug resistance efflux pump